MNGKLPTADILFKRLQSFEFLRGVDVSALEGLAGQAVTTPDDRAQMLR